MNDARAILTPYEADAIAGRVAEGFDGEVLPLEASFGAVLVTGAYDGADLDEAAALVAQGHERLAQMARAEIPY